MSLDSLEKLFLEELKDVYQRGETDDAGASKDGQGRGIPRASGKPSPSHLKETEGQIQRLERVFKELGQPARGKKCKGMEGLLEEGKEMLEEEGEPEVLDAALIASAQQVEHYEIAAYGCLRTYADLLGYSRPIICCSRTSRKRKPPTRSSTSWQRAGSTSRPPWPEPSGK